jgi:T5orf172 domain.
MRGWIYIMSNSSFKGDLVKIGKSLKKPSFSRKDELYTTGVPTPFTVNYEIEVDNYDLAEKVIHRHLKYCRKNKKREFFKISADEANNKILDIIDSLNLGVYKTNSPYNSEWNETAKNLSEKIAKPKNVISNKLKEKERQKNLEISKLERQIKGINF